LPFKVDLLEVYWKSEPDAIKFGGSLEALKALE